MAKYDLAEYAAINAKAYRDYLAKHPDETHVTLTRGQLEAICRDLADYTDRDADARGWAEQATTNAAEIARLRNALDAVAVELRETLRCRNTGDWAATCGMLDEVARVLGNALLGRPDPWKGHKDDDTAFATALDAGATA